MKIKTSELTGVSLDWAVAKCGGLIQGDDLDLGFIFEFGFTPSTDWAQGGPIIEREGIQLQPNGLFVKGRIVPDSWMATIEGVTAGIEGPTPLIAAMRCYVASKLGNEVDVPKGLL